MLLEDDGSGPGGDKGGSEGGEVGGAVVAIVDHENFLRWILAILYKENVCIPLNFLISSYILVLLGMGQIFK